MPNVIKAFRERFHDMKLYDIGDDYPGGDKDRVKYLVRQGFLSVDQDQTGHKRSKKGGSGDDSGA